MTVRADCVVSACSPLPPPIHPFKSSCPLIVRGESAFGQLPSPLVAGLRNKANFPFHQTCLLSIGFRAASSQIWLSVTDGPLQSPLKSHCAFALTFLPMSGLLFTLLFCKCSSFFKTWIRHHLLCEAFPDFSRLGLDLQPLSSMGPYSCVTIST